jgi:hypothetical protein
LNKYSAGFSETVVSTYFTLGTFFLFVVYLMTVIRPEVAAVPGDVSPTPRKIKKIIIITLIISHTIKQRIVGSLVNNEFERI